MASGTVGHSSGTIRLLMGILCRIFSSAMSLAFSLSSSAALSPLPLPEPPRSCRASLRRENMESNVACAGSGCVHRAMSVESEAEPMDDDGEDTCVNTTKIITLFMMVSSVLLLAVMFFTRSYLIMRQEMQPSTLDTQTPKSSLYLTSSLRSLSPQTFFAEAPI
jgi:hypothetical protein